MNRNTDKKRPDRLFRSTKWVLFHLFLMILLLVVIINCIIYLFKTRPDQIGLNIVALVGSILWIFSVITTTICEIFENDELRIYQAKLPTFFTKTFLIFLKLPKGFIKYFGIVLILASSAIPYFF